MRSLFSNLHFFYMVYGPLAILVTDVEHQAAQTKRSHELIYSDTHLHLYIVESSSSACLPVLHWSSMSACARAQEREREREREWERREGKGDRVEKSSPLRIDLKVSAYVGMFPPTSFARDICPRTSPARTSTSCTDAHENRMPFIARATNGAAGVASRRVSVLVALQWECTANTRCSRCEIVLCVFPQIHQQ